MSTVKKYEPIKIALIAVGGDGGGVLTQWIVKLAEKNGFWAQSTTIAGVAQRTGSTVYYIELFPLEGLQEGQVPVLAQMPAQGVVDLVIATEIMEAGRAIQRGFVNEQTTLLFSSHRNLAIREKEVPGDGILDGQTIFELSEKYAKKCLHGNFKVIAEKNHSVISASLFGAIAASKTLPFEKQKFADTVTQSGVAVKTSLAAFEEAYDFVQQSLASPQNYTPSLSKASIPMMPERSHSAVLQKCIDSISNQFPEPLHAVVYQGVLQLIDWQDEKWAQNYLQTLLSYVKKDKVNHRSDYLLTRTIAKNLAIAMSYDDLVNVADIKTRSQRWKEVYKQVGAQQDDTVKVLDFLHPGFEEICGFLPKGLGEKVSQNQKYKAFFKKYLDKDRRMYSSNLFSFLMLYVIGGMKSWRFKTLRHHHEMENIRLWLERIDEALAHNYDLAVQLARSYRLKKGYGDTYHRGDSKFKLINDFAMKYQRKQDVHNYVEHLIAFALQNHQTEALKKKISEISL